MKDLCLAVLMLDTEVVLHLQNTYTIVCNGKERGRMAGKDINKLHEFLKNAGTYYLATMDGDQPRVRPFGTTLLYENKKKNL